MYEQGARDDRSNDQQDVADAEVRRLLELALEFEQVDKRHAGETNDGSGASNLMRMVRIHASSVANRAFETGKRKAKARPRRNERPWPGLYPPMVRFER